MVGVGEGLGEDDEGDRLERKCKEDLSRFHCARNGDDLMIQFECDYCIFRKISRLWNELLRMI